MMKPKVYAPVLIGLAAALIAGCDKPTDVDETIGGRDPQRVESTSRVSSTQQATTPSTNLAHKTASVPSAKSQLTAPSTDRTVNKLGDTRERADGRGSSNEFTQQVDSAEQTGQFAGPLAPPLGDQQQSTEVVWDHVAAMVADARENPSKYTQLARGIDQQSDLAGDTDTAATDDAQSDTDALYDEVLNGSSRTKMYALKELAETHPKDGPEVMTAYEQALYDENPVVRADTIWMLYEQGVPIPSATLLDIAKSDPDREVRARAYITIVDRAEPETRDYLVSASEDPDPQIQSYGRNRIKRIDKYGAL